MKYGLAILETRNYQQAAQVIVHTLEVMKSLENNVTDIYWISDHAPQLNCPSSKIHWIKIAPIKVFPGDLNHPMLRTLPSVCHIDYLLVVQTDGYPVNPQAWTSKFLEYDYIGAAWPWHNLAVGNGGFSLRSRLLMDAMLELDWWDLRHSAEDEIICHHWKNILERDYQIRFAPPDIADQFSIEFHMKSVWLGKSFGFHGKHNIIHHYPQIPFKLV